MSSAGMCCCKYWKGWTYPTEDKYQLGPDWPSGYLHFPHLGFWPSAPPQLPHQDGEMPLQSHWCNEGFDKFDAKEERFHHLQKQIHHNQFLFRWLGFFKILYIISWMWFSWCQNFTSFFKILKFYVISTQPNPLIRSGQTRQSPRTQGLDTIHRCFG